ncbi:MAG: L-fucose:H+ symporter permease [Cytophagaceae bacterium]|nr:L-fucose:H+ symporter permease [Cytophagaceae bacterium]MDW8456701.1 L-fucose:H+ symporter permease [Cytophagaceae bacterium]
MAVVSSSSTDTRKVDLNPEANYSMPLAVLTTLFFMWALATNFNDILIPHLKKACDLSDFESSFVQVAFFFGYGVMAIPAGIMVKNIGYKKAIILGTLTCATGALMFIPAANSREFSFFLVALFTIAGGMTFLQTSANAYVAVLGKPEYSASRLNLAQAFNSVGAAIGPYVAGTFILSGKEFTKEQLMAMSPSELEAWRIEEASLVKTPYMVIALLFIAVCFLIYFSKLPVLSIDKTRKPNLFALGKYRHTLYAALAIFLYVGAEVGIGSYLIRYSEYLKLGYTEKEASIFPTLYMTCAFLGRFSGSFLLRKIKAGNLIAYNAMGSVVLILLSVTTSGYVSLIAIILVGLMNSIMFPTIFTTGLEKTGEYTEEGSSILIAAIIGGAAIAPIMGYVMDYTKNVQAAFWVLIPCYLYILFYGLKGSSTKYLEAGQAYK